MTDSERCENVLSGGRGVCGEPVLRIRTPRGQTVRQCLRCAWRDAGQCWQCGGARTNDLERGVFCDPCGARSLAASNAKSRNKPEAKAKRQAYDAQRYRQRMAQHGGWSTWRD